MASERARRAAGAAVSGIALALGGAGAVAAWRAGLWGTAAGAALAVAWIVALAAWSAGRAADPAAVSGWPAGAEDELVELRALLDQVPLPLVRVAAPGGHARAVNRAARALFATDERILPAPPALVSATGGRLRHEGRTWRTDVVETGTGDRLVALVDVDAEARAADARAADEMIDILGHELLNGLSPIVSLADSAVVAAGRGDPTLPAILATLARRIGGLEGFARAYRTLARLPAPARAPVALDEVAADLALLFAGRFGDAVALVADVAPGAVSSFDRDQIVQAAWALMQNGAEASLAAPPPRGVALTVRVAAGALAIEVRDTGAGVPQSERALAFRPFHTTKPDGSGIGLSLARRIARAHGGDVSLLPELATTFRLEVPAG